jgi:Protein of unknown function (DUF2939)
MRMTLSISAALVALWLAYAVSPFVAAYRLVGAVADRDAAALSAGVDFRAVRVPGCAGRQAAAGELPAPILPARLGLDAVRDRTAGGLAGSPGTGTGEAGIGSSARLRPPPSLVRKPDVA